MKFAIPFTLLAALPFALAAPTCSVKNSASPGPSGATTPGTPSSYSTASAAPVPSSSPSTPPGGSNVTAASGSGTPSSVAMTWFADWHTNFTEAQIPWKQYNVVSFFTAQPDADLHVVAQGVDASLMTKFVSDAHANNVLALVTIGGWSGSVYWSTSVASAQNRTTFATNVVQFAQQYGFDGVDFDWEFPGKQGAGCNVVDPNDTANFLAFVQELRSQAAQLKITAAVGILPWVDSSGNPSADVSGFAKAMDWIEIMNYDMCGSFSKLTGANAPLDDSCSSNPSGSAKSAIAAWTKAGFPAKQIVLGVPSYGHSFVVPASSAVSNNQIQLGTSFTGVAQGDAWDNIPAGSTDSCGNPVGPNGVFNFWAMVGYGFLNSDGSPASGMISTFDSCSQTPFLYVPDQQLLISYDDAKSFAAKGTFVKQNGLLGWAMYEAGGDYNNILSTAIAKAISG